MKGKTRRTTGLIVSTALVMIVLPLLGICAEPKPEGTLKVAWATLCEESFLVDYGLSEQNRMWPMVYDYLFYRHEKTRDYIPGLALRSEYSKDAMNYTLYLRKGVPWQEGWGEFTAEDVKFTLDKHVREGSVSIMKERFVQSVKNVEVVDPYTLKIYFKQPSPDFQATLVDKNSPIHCKKYIEKVGDEKARWEPIGTGPYRLVEHKLGEYLKYEAADKHWRLVPEFKYLYQYIVPEESTRFAMLKTKQIDFAQLTPRRIAEVEKIPWLSAKIASGGYVVFGVFGGMETPKDPRYKEGYHLTDPWAKDKRVREAMALAIDRESIVKAVYYGAAQPIPTGWLFPGWQDLPLVPYDPQKAKRLLAEAGYPKGFDLTVIPSGAWAPAIELPQVMEIIANYFEAIGLRPKIRQMDKAEIFATARQAKLVGHFYGWKDIYRDSWSGKSDERCKPGASISIFQSPEISALIDDYEAECDLSKKEAKQRKLLEYHYNNYITIPIVMAGEVWAMNKEVVGDWPMDMESKAQNIDYIRHAKPLKTFRLFEIN